MKIKNLVILGFVGMFLVIISALLKITHFIFGLINGNLLLFFGLILELLTVILFIVKVLSDRKNNKFINK